MGYSELRGLRASVSSLPPPPPSLSSFLLFLQFFCGQNAENFLVLERYCRLTEWAFKGPGSKYKSSPLIVIFLWGGGGVS